METETFFDLNIGDMTGQWTLSHAVRELIANALDEHTLYNPKKNIEITSGKSTCIIRDYGHGLNHHSFVFSQNRQKSDDNSNTIGRFGVGLKDALAVFEREEIQVEIISKHGCFTFKRMEKCKGVTTLHAIMKPTTHPDMEGTKITLEGNITEDVIQEAKKFFLRYNDNLEVIKRTYYGTVYQSSKSNSNRIYYKGHLIDESPKGFCFSYDIKIGDNRLNNSITRERFNIKKGAYMPRIVTILQNAQTPAVFGPLRNKMHDEFQSFKGELSRLSIREAVDRYNKSKKNPGKAKPTPSNTIKTLLTGTKRKILEELRETFPDEYCIVHSESGEDTQMINGIIHLYLPAIVFKTKEKALEAALGCMRHYAIHHIHE